MIMKTEDFIEYLQKNLLIQKNLIFQKEITAIVEKFFGRKSSLSNFLNIYLTRFSIEMLNELNRFEIKY